ncbi:MAG: hypothetical protein KJ939_01410 [Nanoarchaeota archaeon]|nr:hypothetical protein [Nanoarchaeota archaeon]MBU4351719.1 hypothetical protein [Nanoarchaeota archaeon]
MLVELIGYLGSVLVVISLIPQAYRSWKSKSTKDLSLLRYIIYLFGLFLLIAYGFLISNGPILVLNLSALVIAGFILFLKLNYK